MRGTAARGNDTIRHRKRREHCMKRLFVMVVGAAAITAACKNDTTTAAPPVVASVTLFPDTGSVQVGDTTLALRRTKQLAAELKDAAGNVVSVIQTGDTVVWTSSDATVVSVKPSGIAKGVKVGSATIMAAFEGKSSNTSTIRADTVVATSVTMSPTAVSVKVAANKTLSAFPFDAAGDTLKVATSLWTSSDTLVAVVSNADSLNVVTGNKATITGVATGAATITATIAGHSATAAVTVVP
jgi:uncharacterized protein YjdB